MACDHTAGRQPVPWPEFGSGGLEAGYVRRLIDFVDARLYLADHRVLLLLQCLLTGRLPATLHDQAADAVLGFRFSLLEPGFDSLALWTENHQVTAATAEYLTGQLFEDRIFTNDGRSAARHKRAAQARLMLWMADRFRFGFSEWLSNTYYAFDLAALAMLVDHAADKGLADRAAMVIDLALTDVALHSFRGRFAPSMGRAHAEQIINPDRAEIAPIIASAFGEGPPTLDIESLSSIFVARQRYQVPAALREIAGQRPVRQVLSSQGLDAGEVRQELRAHPYYPRSQGLELMRFWWGQQAVTTPETIVESVRALRALELGGHRTLAPMARYTRLPDRALTPTLLALNPITSGAALHRVNVQTTATGNYLLSSAQRYKPGGFGDQQHLWHASLPGNIQVFGTHPGSTQLTQENRPLSPGLWVGNGINPDIAQHHNVLLALYDLQQRKGMFEGRRHEMVHIHFPFVLFDQTRIGPSWIAGRRDDAYIGILGTHHFEQTSETEVVQRGTRTGYAVVLGDDEEYTSLAGFLRQLKQCQLWLNGRRLAMTSPYGRYELPWQGDFKVNGRVVQANYPRYDAPGILVPRNPSALTITGTDHRLELDWASGQRVESSVSS